MSQRPEPGPENDVELDDLGLSPADWDDLRYAYTHGLADPAPGTVEAAAFDRLDGYARHQAEPEAGQ